MSYRFTPTRPLLLVALLTLCACSNQGSEASVEQAEIPVPASDSSGEDFVALPEREGPRRETTGSVPHMQLDAEPVADVDAELRRKVGELPGVEINESARSLPGASGFWLTDDVDPERPEVMGGSREFAHVHPDGSLHVWLPVDRAAEVDDKKWGELHPWVGNEGFWDGVVMIFTPESADELEVVMGLIVDSYNYVVGANLDPEDVT